MKKSLFYLNILVFIIIIANIYKPIENYIQWVVFPFDLAFSNVSEYLEVSEIKNDEMKNIKEQINNYNLKTNGQINIDINTKPGVVLFENGKYYRVKTSKNIKKGSYVIDNNNDLIGFVERSINDIVFVKKIGWGDNQFFAMLNNNDVLVEEHYGDIYIELPDNIKINQKKLVTINTPFYIKDMPINLKGEFLSKIGDKFIFEPTKLNVSTVYIMEVN